MLPIDFIENFLDSTHRVREVSLSVYRYYPQSLVDSRVVHTMPFDRLRQRFEKIKGRLGSEEDVAFQSLVKLGGRGRRSYRHVPLIDFQTDEQELVIEAAEQLISEQNVPTAALFSSGRSFHLYLGVLKEHDEWVKFMGRTLLFNPRGGPEIIDARWVGHRLMAGYAALRWTNNSSRYQGLPTFCRSWPSVDNLTASKQLRLAIV